MVTTEKRKSNPRFRRVPTGNLCLQKRDLEILKYIYEHRFLTSDHIAALVPAGQQGIRRRLYKLFHAGYLDRPREQVRPFRKGNYPYVYGLSRKGFDQLPEKIKSRTKGYGWTGKNREAKQRYIDHTLLVSHFMVALELACRKRGYVALIQPHKLMPKNLEPERYRPGSLLWTVDITRKYKGRLRQYRLSAVPDKIFGLYYLNDRMQWRFDICFLEADRSTMPIARSNLFASSYRKKMIGYLESKRQNLYWQMFGRQSVRVLTVTKQAESKTARKRIRNMMKVAKDLDPRGRNSRMFLFAQAREFPLTDPDRILKPVWRNAWSQEPVSLIY
jgi:predicted transcriptional regulator